MSWKTRVFASYDAWMAAGRPIGAIIPVPEADRRLHDGSWPDRHQGVAAVFYVALPTLQLWCPWQKAFNGALGFHGDGWDVSGPPDRLTATPSIDVHGYHGYLRDGEITDDIGGRSYPTRPIMESPNDTPPTLDETSVERRSPDQDAALEQGFAAGALPESDRRETPDPEPEIPAAPTPTPEPEPEIPAALTPTPIPDSPGFGPAAGKPQGKLIVRATARGFHDCIREPGDEFEVPADTPVGEGSWLILVREF